MSDIREWLQKLGLGQYAEAFDENDIALDVVAQLTDADFKELGVTLGNRKRLLTAIEALSATGAATQDGVAAPPREAERRQLTVMFCDLVGSTALSKQLDPEDLRALMTAYRKAASEVIARYDGHVAQYLGDGVMAYFGWPRAHEDDGERAVRAALDIVAAVKRVEAADPLRLRVGIATGPVVVGEGKDDDAEATKLAVGETPNLAARLQGLAGADEIVIGQGTHDLIRGAFEYDDLGARSLKGIQEPVQAWRVTGASQAEGRFEAQSVGGLTPFVGRQAEITMLLDRWAHAKDGEGQVVLLEGEPGIGKSRITQELRRRLTDEPHTRLNYQCSAYYTNSAFFPIITQLERAAGFNRDDSSEAKLDKLETTLAQGTDKMAQVAPLIAAMLSLPVERYPPINLSPQRQKDGTIAALAAQVTGLARHQPMFLLFEDAHWCDPTTIDTLTAVIAAIEAAPVLIVITYRPEFDPPWTGHGHVTVQSLSRLGRRQGADMVNWVTGGKALPDEVVRQIVAKTDGIPLFVEELTKTVLEAGFLLDAGDHYEIDGQVPALAIPSTLQDSLMARLDRLSQVKEVAQIGACIGREFSYELLAGVSPLGDHKLQAALRELASSELVFQRGSPPEATYTFKHALIQDAAYESLLKSRRQEMHRRIAVIMSEQFPDQIEATPEIVARHYTEAGETEVAIKYWLAAGQRATERSGYIEAISHLQTGLQALSDLPESGRKDSTEIDLQVALGVAFIAAKGYAAPETGAAYERARALCAKLGDPPEVFQVFYGLWVFYRNTRPTTAARDLAGEFVTKAERMKQRASSVVANRLLGHSHMDLGDFTLALKHADRTLALYDPEQDRSLTDTYTVDPRATALMVRSLALWNLGFPDQAKRTMSEAISWAEEIRHPLTLAYILSFGWIDYYLRAPEEVLLRTNRCLTISREHDFGPEMSSISRCTRGWALVYKGDLDNGLAEVKAGNDACWATGSSVVRAGAHTMFAEACTATGQFEEAKDALDQAFSAIEEYKEARWEAECHRIAGDLLLRSNVDQQVKAAAAYQAAIEVAQSQQSKSFELRAATSLARLWHSHGNIKDAHELLAPVYEWFTEGFDTADLKDAKALLDELN